MQVVLRMKWSGSSYLTWFYTCRKIHSGMQPFTMFYQRTGYIIRDLEGRMEKKEDGPAFISGLKYSRIPAASPTLIQLGRIPRSPEDRQLLISEQVAQEERIANMGIDRVRMMIVEYLVSEKAFLNEDMETEKEFRVELNEASFNVKADIVIRIGGVGFLLAKCAMSSPESWERYSIALCRVACSETFPFCLVTDGEFVRLINAQTGEIACEDFKKLPSRTEAVRLLDEISKTPFSCAKPDKEKRILFAFSGIGCPTQE